MPLNDATFADQTLESIIEQLESSVCENFEPETTLVRMSLPTVKLADYGMERIHERETHKAWCLSLGIVMVRRRARFYGHTIEEAIRAAAKALL